MRKVDGGGRSSNKGKVSGSELQLQEDQRAEGCAYFTNKTLNNSCR